MKDKKILNPKIIALKKQLNELIKKIEIKYKEIIVKYPLYEKINEKDFEKILKKMYFDEAFLNDILELANINKKENINE